MSVKQPLDIYQDSRSMHIILKWFIDFLEMTLVMKSTAFSYLGHWLNGKFVMSKHYPLI